MTKDEFGFEVFDKCPMCGCDSCPHGKSCTRRQQDATHFRPCPACSCFGTWQFSSSLTTDKIITEQGEQLDMLPSAPSRQGETIARAGNNASGGVPKLSSREVTFDKREARIIGVRVIEGKYGPQVVVKISYNSSAFLWYLNLTNPNYELLTSALGVDENQWVDATFMLANETDDFSGKTWPTASVITKSGGKKKAK